MSDTEQMTITEFLEARIAEDEKLARGAIDPDRPGTHWQWVTTETDTVVAPGETPEALNYQDISLRSVEEFATYGAGKLPAFIINSVDEMLDGAGEHIARHDPARVLAECAAKRAVISACREDHEDAAASRSDVVETASVVLYALATVYSDHPDYRQDWT